jgi:uncharacterized protein YecE (DUF72 family)
VSATAGAAPSNASAVPPPGAPRRVLAGTSGFGFKEWKGGFYPADLPAARFLSFYAARLPTVEINASFYRMPAAETFATWKNETPESFRFTVKAHRSITHMKRLRGVDENVRWLYDRVVILGPRLGPVLFQFPPTFKRDLALLQDFLAGLPPLPYVALEFRHATWHDDAVYDTLRTYRAALCIAEDDESGDPRIHTAPWGYYRLHRLQYTDDQIAAWAEHLAGAPDLSPVFCYFTHDTGPEAITYAERLMALASAADAAAARSQ